MGLPGFALVITLALGAVGSSSVRAAEPPEHPAVGMLVTHAVLSEPGEALRKALREFGYLEGRNIRLEIVTAAGDLDRLQSLAQHLVRRKVDVIICPNEVSARAVMHVTDKIPIVMQGFSSDPVAAGLIDSFARPGGNITGIYSLSPELQSKRLELLKEALPGLSRVAVLWDSDFPVQFHEELQRAAKRVGVQTQYIEVHSSRELGEAIRRSQEWARRSRYVAGEPHVLRLSHPSCGLGH
jgi:putative ABC transport system substrate-binding protein